MDLEHSLGNSNQYNGLYGEVVTNDIYHLRDVDDIVSINDPTHIHVAGHVKKINFVPDVVFDLGANVGIFTRYARSLFHNALIVSVEPHPSNIETFKQFTLPDENIVFIEKAIGKGKISRCPDAKNGAMEVYLSEGLGYNKEDIEGLKSTDVDSIMLTDLKQYVKGKTILKLDIEGNETVIFDDPASVEMMKTFDYIVMELHYFANDGDKLRAVRKKTDKILKSFNKTHNTVKDGIYFYAVKK